MNNMDLKNRAEEIKERSFIADAHLDLAYDIVRKRSYGRRKVLEEDYYEDMTSGGLNLVISSIFIDDKYIPETALKRALLQVEALLEDIEESENFEFCLNKEDIDSAYSRGKISIMLSFEGIEPIQKVGSKRSRPLLEQKKSCSRRIGFYGKKDRNKKWFKQFWIGPY